MAPSRNVGEGKFTVVSPTHVEIDCLKINAWSHKGSGAIELKDGTATIALKNTGGEFTTLTGTYRPERYWLNLDLKVGIVPIWTRCDTST